MGENDGRAQADELAQRVRTHCENDHRHIIVGVSRGEVPRYTVIESGRSRFPLATWSPSGLGWLEKAESDLLAAGLLPTGQEEKEMGAPSKEEKERSDRLRERLEPLVAAAESRAALIRFAVETMAELGIERFGGEGSSTSPVHIAEIQLSKFFVDSTAMLDRNLVKWEAIIDALEARFAPAEEAEPESSRVLTEDDLGKVVRVGVTASNGTDEGICGRCGQSGDGKTGEHPCPDCGRPTTHDADGIGGEHWEELRSQLAERDDEVADLKRQVAGLTNEIHVLRTASKDLARDLVTAQSNEKSLLDGNMLLVAERDELRQAQSEQAHSMEITQRDPDPEPDVVVQDEMGWLPGPQTQPVLRLDMATMIEEETRRRYADMLMRQLELTVEPEMQRELLVRLDKIAGLSV